MGSVPELYISGDNDPEIDPVQYYRHYLYCDACSSFELVSWMKPDHHEQLEKRRQQLAKAALFATPFVLVPGWLALGLVPSLAFLAVLATGIVLSLVFRGLLLKALGGVNDYLATRWGLLKAALPWLVVVVVAQWLATDFFLPHWVTLIAGLILVVGLLAWREFLGSRIESLGMRCRPCGATYAHGTAFFTNLDANPRGLTVADVPRPLGSSYFEVGASVDYQAPEPRSRLPE